MLSAIILAAGNSSRMGAPKAILKLGGKTFLEIISLKLKEAGLEEIFVVLGKDRDKILQAWRPDGEKLVFNPQPELGQLHSLRLALRMALETPL